MPKVQVSKNMSQSQTQIITICDNNYDFFASYHSLTVGYKSVSIVAYWD